MIQNETLGLQITSNLQGERAISNINNEYKS